MAATRIIDHYNELTGAPVYDQIRFRPGDTSGDAGIATTWTEVKAAIDATQGRIMISIDNSLSPCVVDQDTNCYGLVTFMGGTVNQPTLNIADGFQLIDPLGTTGVQITGTPTIKSSILNTLGNAMVCERGGGYTLLVGSTLPLIETTSPFAVYARYLNGAWDNSAVPTVPLITVATGSTTIVVSLDSGLVGAEPTSMIDGDATSTLIKGGDANNTFPAQSMFAGTVIEQRTDRSSSLLWSYGDTASRPTDAVTGQPYFDTDLDSVVTWNGTSWVGGSGNALQFRGVDLDTTAPTTDYQVYSYVSASNTFVITSLTLDMIGPAFAISVSGGTTVEIGATITSQSLSISYTGTATAPVTLTDSEGSPTTTLISPFTSVTSPLVTSKTANNSTVTYTIHANSKTGTTTTAWRPRVYFGSATPGAHDEAFIEALASSALASSRNRTISVSATAGQRAYYAIPSSYGTPVFTIGGFVTTHTLMATVSVTNVNGVTQNYDLWASDIFGGSTSYSNVVT